MSSTNKTANLQLSQFVGTDIPSILTDYNGDMRKIDAGVQEAKTAVAGAVSDLSSVTARVGNVESDVTGLNSAVQGVASRVISVEGDVDNLETSVAGKADASAVTAIGNRVTAIEDVVPSSASASNMLATMADVSGGVNSYALLATLVATSSTSDANQGLLPFFETYIQDNSPANYFFIATSPDNNEKIRLDYLYDTTSSDNITHHYHGDSVGGSSSSMSYFSANLQGRVGRVRTDSNSGNIAVSSGTATVNNTTGNLEGFTIQLYGLTNN